MLFLSYATAHAQATGNPHHTARLEALARLDAAVHYFHPTVATSKSVWDSAFANAAMRVADAPDGEAYRHEIARLVRRIGDAATRVVTPLPMRWTGTWMPDSVLLLRVSSDRGDDARLLTNAAAARAVVIDCRGAVVDSLQRELAYALLAQGVTAPQQRALQYNGFPAATFRSSGDYRLTWRVIPGERFDGRARRDQHIAFVVDSASVLPALAMALHNEGRAQIVGVAISKVAVAGQSYRVSMGEDVFVDVRLGTSASMDEGVQTDTTVSTVRTGILVAGRRAAQSARSGHTDSETPIDTTSAVTPMRASDDVEWRAGYPAVGYRVLAAARLWSTIRLFFPYKSLMGENWDAALHSALPAVEHASDALAYGNAIARLAWYIHDSHVTVSSAALGAELWGNGGAPVVVRFVEQKLIVTRVVDSSAIRGVLRVGDEIVSVDGEAIAQRVARFSPNVVSSTPQALDNWLARTILASGVTRAYARLTVRDAAGELRTAEITYRPLQRMPTHPRTGRIFRLMPGNVGYVDLDRLPQTQVDSMFSLFAGTKGIVFDMRGYPQGIAWTIAPRLNTHPGRTVGAQFRGLRVISPDTALTTTYSFDQPIPPSVGATPYSGRTVLLIDERTISQAEHTGLFFEAANGTAFIGSPSMGANGDVTNFILPGSITISFSGHDVRHADGRQLQRVGLVPTVPVLPTVAGVRAGRDEVLEAGLKYVGGTGEMPADMFAELPRPPKRSLSPETLPTGWVTGGVPESYRIGTDRSVAHGGSSSGHVTAREPDAAFGALNQFVRAERFRGKRVRLSAYVKTRGVAGTAMQDYAGIWLRVDGNGGVLAFDNMQSRPITGTTDWTRVSIVLDVPAEAAGIGFGMLLVGDGEAWIDDATLEVVGAEIAPTAVMAPQADSSKAAAQKASYERLPLEPSNLDFEH